MTATTCLCSECRSGQPHRSDCAVHNEPAMPKGPCDCGMEGDAGSLLNALFDSVERARRDRRNSGSNGSNSEGQA